MENITSTLGANIGGIASIKLADIDWITNLPGEEFNNLEFSTELLFASGKAWTVVKPEHDSASLAVTPKSGKFGLYSEVKAEFVINLVELTKLESLQSASYRRIAALITDNNGTTYIIGSKYKGASLQYEQLIDASPEGKTWFKVQLFLESEAPCLIYNP